VRRSGVRLRSGGVIDRFAGVRDVLETWGYLCGWRLGSVVLWEAGFEEDPAEWSYTGYASGTLKRPLFPGSLIALELH